MDIVIDFLHSLGNLQIVTMLFIILYNHTGILDPKYFSSSVKNGLMNLASEPVFNIYILLSLCSEFPLSLRSSVCHLICGHLAFLCAIYRELDDGLSSFHAPVCEI